MCAGPVLALDFSTSVASVAITSDGTCVSTVENAKMRTHVSHCQQLIQDVLHEAGCQMSDLIAISTNIGPGSYTGLRVALSAAKAITYALDLPILAYPGAMILRSSVDPDLAVAIDAQKGYNYYLDGSTAPDDAALYSRIHDDDIVGRNQPVVSNNATLVNLLQSQSSQRVCHYRELRASLQAHLQPSATVMHSGLAELSALTPLYVLPPNITVRKKPLIS